MIKARGTNSEGNPMVILGLSGENVTRLMADEPITFDLQELGLPSCQVVIVGGRTEQAIVEQLRSVGLLAPDLPVDDRR